MTERTVDQFFQEVTQKVTDKNEVFYQEWLESERGWGVRPDGYSLHLSLSDHQKYITDYWGSMPDEVPDEYSRPYGEPSTRQVKHSIYLKLSEARDQGRFGLRFYR